jgi:hypothetical protein
MYIVYGIPRKTSQPGTETSLSDSKASQNTRPRLDVAEEKETRLALAKI